MGDGGVGALAMAAVHFMQIKYTVPEYSQRPGGLGGSCGVCK